MQEPCEQRTAVKELAICIGRHEERLSDLERSQQHQNGTMNRIEQKLDDMIGWLARAALGFIATLLTIMIAWMINM